MKSLVFIPAAILVFWGSFLVVNPVSVFAEEVNNKVTESTENPKGEESTSEDVEKPKAPETKEGSLEEKITETPVAVEQPAVETMTQAVVSPAEEIKTTIKPVKKRIASAVKPAPLAPATFAVDSATIPAVATAVPQKVIPANPSFTPNEFPENPTLVLFSKIRPALIVLALLYLFTSTLYLKNDARKWKKIHWK